MRRTLIALGAVGRRLTSAVAEEERNYRYQPRDADVREHAPERDGEHRR